MEKCKATVYPKERYGSFHGHRCHRFEWKDGYCKQHHPETQKLREEKSELKYKEKMERNPYRLLEKAEARIKELEMEIEELKRKVI